ncbi:MoxR family ATPase [Alteromonas sp. 5E99-2]|uniref:AAA family ATPase n=1 Tax=Alteromonas sp. 5E99-2 TaxID=2817683 RepID=UPI001A98637F|nr:MoxR family ATPase [Alteromonas sp. 5E99-2]MBO1256152.1 MoxR family ATPase [Alteromonas sp. 5E99-2]
MTDKSPIDQTYSATGICDKLKEVGYLASADLGFSLSLMYGLNRPLLLEGEAGVGKTSLAKSLSKIYGSKLIRLQCHEGLSVNQSVYEWNYQRQLLSIKLLEGKPVDTIEDEIYSEKYLLQRPLLEAIRQPESPILLIDEIDRADDEFEAFLLEVLGEFQITIPEFGSIKAKAKPRVILTSNGTRELSDALRRRCLYNYIDYPNIDEELHIVRMQLPNMDIDLASQLVRFVKKLRSMQLRKVPGVAETLDWAEALMCLGFRSLDEDLVSLQSSLVCLLKYQEDKDNLGPETVKKMVGSVL